MHSTLFLIPLLLAFEFWQLVMADRYVGVKPVREGLDPRSIPMSEKRAFVWVAALFAYWLWMGFLLGTGIGRVQAICLIAVSALGFALRRIAPLKAVIVILTFEGAIRIGMLISLGGVLFRRLGAD